MSDADFERLAAWMSSGGGSVDRLLRLFGLMDAAQLERFGDGLTNIYVVLDREFERRFPKEFAVWQKRRGGE